MTSPLAPIMGVLGGCMGCMIFVEKIAKAEPSSMNLMTFSTFLFIASHGLIFTSKFFTVPNKIPLKGYIPTVITFFTVNVINNQALNFHVPVPLHIIFRSGSLLANLLLSVILLKKKYTLRKYLSVFAITIGIVICTLATSDLEKNSGLSYEEATKHYREWTIGIAMLVFALLASAYLAICQQRMYETYGKHSDEAMFVIFPALINPFLGCAAHSVPFRIEVRNPKLQWYFEHAISLPLFSLMGADIMAAAMKFNESAPYEIVGITIPVPSLWMNLFFSCVLQYYCIRFVYRLNSEVEALTVTLVVTLRKFLSLVVSIWWFQNPFTYQHWIGAALVFSGTLAFADVWDFGNVEKKKKN